MRKQFSLFNGFVIGSAFLISACQNVHNAPNEFSKFGFTDAIYSNRPQTDDGSIAILKLQNQALLATSERKDGKLVIDQELLKAIEVEQTATIAELQKISPEIKVLIKYKLVLNGLAVLVPPGLLEKIQELPNVTMAERSAAFSRPKEADVAKLGAVGERTSVNFIGADAAYAQNLRGEGMRVGVIDTGIDYTHKMLLGEGTVEAYKAVVPAQPSAAFPNKKVVGGIDLVGTDYDSASPIFAKRIPTPDANPIDEAGHGTHVAGTIAGVGDGVNTYSGVAPSAELYAIKVFGAKGSTNDEVVIAALEYAADPTGDLTFSQQLDVVNLSLGSGYGNPHMMYAHAVKNLVRGGTVVVASAGNSGDNPYIVGAPSTTEDSISVASSIDNQLQNILFPTVSFQLGAETLKAEMVEASITKELSTFPELKGEVVFAGWAETDFDAAAAAKIAGKVALIDRGKATFAEKIGRAQKAGAIAVVVANHKDGDPEGMGGEGKFDIPAVMIAKSAGDAIKAKLATEKVTVDLKSNEKIEKPWVADTMSSFSSRGPRSEDGLIKPEISAPGSNIISADVGGGEKGVQMSGTSMAGPHIAGVMALLRQKFVAATPAELKSILMGHGKLIADKDKKQYTVSRQGAGRVQVAESLDAKVVTVPAALSFGISDLETSKTLSQEISIKNISAESLTLKPEWKGSAGLQLSVSEVTLAAGEMKKVLVTAKASSASMKDTTEEFEGFLTFANDKGTLVQIPALLVARKISQISAKSLKVKSSSAADGAGSVVELQLQNLGKNGGTAQIFNLLGKDGRKQEINRDYAHNKNCDLQSAGYRIVEKEGGQVLQVAVKLYQKMTTWNTCEVNVQIDSDGDGVTDQEIAGLPQSNLAGLTGDNFVSLLLNGTQAREIRKKYEADIAAPVSDPKKEVKEDYTKAVQDLRPMATFDGSTIAIIEANVAILAVSATGELNVKVSTTHQDSGIIEYDDYLATNDARWEKLSLSANGQAFTQIPEEVELAGGEVKTLSLQKGYGMGDLIVYVPENRSVVDPVLEDSQSQVVKPSFGE